MPLAVWDSSEVWRSKNSGALWKPHASGLRTQMTLRNSGDLTQSDPETLVFSDTTPSMKPSDTLALDPENLAINSELWRPKTLERSKTRKPS